MHDDLKMIRIVLGDITGDGHKQTSTHYIMANKSVEEMRVAYVNSCKTLHLTFDDYEPTEGGTYLPELQSRIMVEYRGDVPEISQTAKDILIKNGCPLTEEEFEWATWDGPEYIKLLMWFIQFSLPDLVWEENINPAPILNWGKDFKLCMGYGLFD